MLLGGAYILASATRAKTEQALPASLPPYYSAMGR